MKRCIIIALCFVSFFATAQSSKEEQVWQRVEALTKAVFDTKDSIALVGLVSDHLTYGHSAGSLEDKATMVHKAASSKTQYKNPSFERVSIDVDGPTAIVRHNFRAISVENGKETPLDLSILQVWKQERGQWRLWARQAVKIPPKS
ncbi:MAG: nuclear transport factor 2 family protein [Flavisolibacter sp.]|nr:nuclear transport factor 2 family protein [Flavisolibacter sp.]MBD0366330.1 nuclear transport factor 2 family protein [Flavisolibacter sp.]